MKFRSCTREEFVAAITTDKADVFAKTFVAKADMQKQWNDCLGAYTDDSELMSAIITTISKREPKTANLQLLHTFVKHRGKGVAKQLTEADFMRVYTANAQYFRVSAEPDAIGFYEKLGFKFWGKQKSGCSLSMFKIKDTNIFNGLYDDNDPVIRSALYSGKKGSLASSYEEKSKIYLL